MSHEGEVTGKRQRPPNHHPDRPTPSPPRERGRRSTSPLRFETPPASPLPRAHRKRRRRHRRHPAPPAAPLAVPRLLDCCMAARSRLQWPAYGRALNQRVAMLAGRLAAAPDGPPVWTPATPCALARLQADASILRHSALMLRREFTRVARPVCATCTDVLCAVDALLVRAMAVVRRVRVERPPHVWCVARPCRACLAWGTYARRMPAVGRPIVPPALRLLLYGGPVHAPRPVPHSLSAPDGTDAGAAPRQP